MSKSIKQLELEARVRLNKKYLTELEKILFDSKENECDFSPKKIGKLRKAKRALLKRISRSRSCLRDIKDYQFSKTPKYKMAIANLAKFLFVRDSVKKWLCIKNTSENVSGIPAHLLGKIIHFPKTQIESRINLLLSQGYHQFENGMFVSVFSTKDSPAFQFFNVKNGEFGLASCSYETLFHHIAI